MTQKSSVLRIQFVIVACFHCLRLTTSISEEEQKPEAETFPALLHAFPSALFFSAQKEGKTNKRS